ncbi:MarR family winged helix-turn-helix transcriptional regulator [Oxobacter pfennigii]|uniref:MarR family winged helix-turn-helix transcriptional regulator n=1 Tax=Oxobacter pfennigii TaxID=36849 RepID=UPI001FA6DDD9|nr:MarR family transcriptional regulator [Oxobacter pfennigii]
MKNEVTEPRTETLHMAIIRLNRIHRKRRHEEFIKVGLTEGQPKILDFLLQNDGCIQRELAESCHIEPATVTSILASMEKAELIRREADPKDRRVLRVFLTDKGRDSQKKVEKLFDALDEECFAGFSEEEKRQAINILSRLHNNMTNREGKDV